MAKSKRPRGRPKKKPEDSKAEMLQVRLESVEKEAFTAAARLSGMELSVWTRDRLRRAAREELQQVGEPVPFLPFQRDEPIG
jgi:hypothetical protein